jgi:Transposase DDE domain
MATSEAKVSYLRRKKLFEPTFGIMKDQIGLRCLLLHGLDNIKGEIFMVATAFNLRSLYRRHQQWHKTRKPG